MIGTPYPSMPFNFSHISKIAACFLFFLFITAGQLNAQEICNNGIDDDGDELVDVFDPDCPCDDQTLLCQPSCEFAIGGGALNYSSQWASNALVPVYQTPLVADMNNDGVPDVIIMSTNGVVESDPRRAKDILIINGATGATITTITTPFMAWVGPDPVAVADIDGDGFGEVIIAAMDHSSNDAADRRYLYCYEHDGTLKWKSDSQFGYPSIGKYGSALGIADFNSDGTPEVYVYNQIFNSLTGVKLAEGGATEGMGIMTVQAFGDLSNPVAANLTTSPGIELAAGRTVYNVVITNVTGTAGNSMTPISVPSENDGYTSLADINLDGSLDIVVAVGGNPGRIYVWNPGNGTPVVIASLNLSGSGGNWIGVPFIGDMDKDCQPEIGVVRSRIVYALEYDNTATLQTKWTLSTSDASGFTGITMFDFNQDGTQELVYRDETTLRIIDGSGATPVVIGTTPCSSGTGSDMPVVADVDGDGQAEICVTCATQGVHIGRVNVFESSTSPWAPTRPIWNQYNYFNVNISNNLRIPLQQQQHQVLLSTVTCPFYTCNQNRPFNSFLAQSTFLTQEGCPIYPASDVALTILNSSCTGSGQLNLSIQVTNVGNAPSDPNYPVQFYAGNPLTNGAAIRLVSTPAIVQTGVALAPAASETINLSIDITTLPKPFNLFVLLNDDGNGIAPFSYPQSSLPECDFTDDVASITGVDCCPSGDLTITGITPPNATICQGGNATFTVNATSTIGLSNAVYTWTLPNLSTQTGNSITATSAGNYSISVKDNAQCTVTSSVNITVTPQPTAASAGQDQTICADTTTLQGNVPSVGTGTWTLISGTGTISNPSLPTSNVSGIGIGTSTFEWSIVNGGVCISADTVAITRIEQPTISNGGTNQQICADNATLQGNVPLIGTGSWTLVSGSGTITNPADENSTVTGLGNGVNVFQWTISNGTCVPSTSQVIITRNAEPSIADAGADQTICSENTNLNALQPLSGTGTWTVVSGGATLTNAALNNSGVSDLAVGPNVFRWTISSGNCPTNFADVTITRNEAPTTAIAGNDQTICLATATFLGNTPTIGTGAWALVTGTGTIANAALPNSTISNLGFGENIFTWTITNGVCPISIDQVSIARDTPPSIADAGINQTICADNAILSATTPTTGAGTWTLITGTGTFTDASQANTNVTGLSTGNNVFAFTITNGVCPSTTDQVTISVDEPVVNVSAGSEQQICATSTTLQGNNPTVGTGIWTLISGGGTIVNPNSFNSNLTAIPIGANVFRWTVTNGTCSAFAEVTITRSEEPSAAIAGIDQSLCGTTTVLAATTPLIGSGNWTVNSGTATFTDPSNPTDQISGLSVGANSLIWTVSNGSCPTNIDTVVINVSANPIIPNAGVDQQICANTATLNAIPANVGTGTWTLISGSGNITSINSPTSPITNLGIGENVFRWTIVNGPCTVFDQVSITQDALPSTAVAGTDQTICADNTLLAATLPAIGTGTWSVTSGSATIADTLDNNSSINNLSTGITTLTWTVTSGVCPISTEEISITVNEIPSNASAGANQTICADTAQLNAVAPLIGSGVWSVVSGSGILASPNTAQSNVSGLSNGPNVFRWKVSNGVCPSDSADVTIFVDVAPTAADAGVDQSICSDTISLNANDPILGTGFWTIVTGSATFIDPGNPATLVSSVGVGVNVLQWNIGNGTCPPSTDQIVITRDSLPVQANAGADLSRCNSDTVTLQGEDAFPGVGNWTVVSGAGTFTDNSLFNTSVSGLGLGTNVFRFTVTTGNCPSTFDEVTVINSLPPSNASAGNDTSICGTVLNLNAETPATGNGAWTVESGTGIFSDGTNPSANVSNLSPSLNTLRWTISNGSCPVVFDEVQITVDKLPVIPNAGIDATICADTLSLSAALPNIGTGAWSLISGTGTIADVSSPTSFVSGIAVGTSVFEWTITSGLCVISDSVSITRVNPPSAALAGLDQTICDSSATLNATVPLIGNGTWTLVNGNGTFTDANNAGTLVTNLSIGINEFRWTVSSGNCPVNEDVVLITRQDQATIADAGIDRSICADTATLNGNVALTGTGTWTLISGTGTITNANDAVNLVSGIGLGANVFRWTIAANGACPESFDEVTITRDTPPSVAFAGNDDSTCTNSFALNAIVPSIGIGSWSIIAGNAILSDTSSANTNANNLNIGPNVFEWRVTNGSCPDQNDLITITRGDTANAGTDQVLCDSTTILDATPTIGGYWTVVSGAGTFADSSLANTTVTGLGQGINIFQWNIQNALCPDSTDQVTIEKRCNIPPVLVNENITIDEDSVLIGDLLANGDIDPDGTPLTVDTIAVTPPTNGSVVINADGTFTYTPNENFFGSDTIVVNICDNGTPLPPICGFDTLIITINPVNDEPIIENETVTTTVDNPVSGNFLTNDVDPDSTTITIEVIPVTEPNNGTIVINPDGSFEYTPNAGFAGTDTVVVEICDSGFPLPEICGFDTLIIFVNDTINDAPVTISENFEINEDDILDASYLNGDFDPDGTELVYDTVATFGPTHGEIIIGSDGSFTYIPDENYYGNDTVIVNVCDNGIPLPAECSLDTIFIIILPVNDAPVIENETIITSMDSTITGNFLDNDYDPDSTELFIEVIPVTEPTNGIIIINPDGSYTYTPNEGFSGSDTVVVEICDSGLPLPELCDFDTLIIIVNDGLNDPPVAISENFEINEDDILEANFINGDSDPDGTELTVDTIPLFGPLNGEIFIFSDGSFTYTPNENYYGTDTIIVTVCDNGIPLPAECVQDTIFIVILPVNDAPIIVGEEYASAGEEVVGNILDNDFDPDSTVLSVDTIPISGPTNGTIDINPDGSFVYTPDEGFAGSDTIVVTVCDSGFPLPVICGLDTIIIVVEGQPLDANAGENQNICFFTTTLDGNATFPPQTGLWTVSFGSGIVQEPNVANSLVTNLSIGVNQFIWTVTSGSQTVSDTVDIVVNEPATPAFAGEDITICGISTPLSANIPTNGVGTWSLASGSGNISDPSATNIQVVGLQPGANILVWTIVNGTCISVDSVIVTSFTEPISITSNDTSYCEQVSSIQLIGNTPQQSIGNWSVVSGAAIIGDSTVATTTATGLSVGTNQFIYTVSNGPCSVIDTFTVNYISSAEAPCFSPSVFIPEGFSPDQDGVNDRFVIYGLNGQNVSLEIYNRWGNLVYKNDNYANDWDGTSNSNWIVAGDNLPEGTYYYLVQISGESEVRKGYLTLWR